MAPYRWIEISDRRARLKGGRMTRQRRECNNPILSSGSSEIWKPTTSEQRGNKKNKEDNRGSTSFLREKGRWGKKDLLSLKGCSGCKRH